MGILKKMLILLLVVFVVGVFVSTVVIADSYSFKLDVNASKSKISEEEEIEVTIRISEINAGNNGIGALKFKLNYDGNIFEKVTESNITYKNEWKDVTYSETNSIAIFLQSKSPYTTTDEEVCVIKLKAKDNLTSGSTKIYLTEIEGSNYDTSIQAADTETDITIEGESEYVPVTSVSLKEKTTIEKGKTESLVATISPSNATNKNVTWSSSDESIATVDGDGKVTAVKEGVAIITVTTQDLNKEAQCTVTVTNNEDNDDSSSNNNNNTYSNTSNSASGNINSTSNASKVGSDGILATSTLPKTGYHKNFMFFMIGLSFISVVILFFKYRKLKIDIDKRE